MARGRFISKSVIADRAVNDLSSDTCRLAFVFLIVIADREGRTVGEPVLLAASLFPRRQDITPDMIEGFIYEWIDAGFVIWYREDEDSDRYLQFVNFEKHQKGLRKDREAESMYPDPEDCQIISGHDPEASVKNQVKYKVNIKNKTKVKDNVEPIKDNSLIIHTVARELGDDQNLHDACLKAYNYKKGRDKKSNSSFAVMINDFEKIGVTVSDYLEAIDQYDRDGRYPGDQPSTYHKWTMNLVEKRNKKNKVNNQDPVSYKKSWLPVSQ